MNDQRIAVLYCLLTCGLLLALSVNDGVYALLMLTSLLAGVCLWPLRHTPGILLSALSAFLLIVYVGITPGKFFTDLPVAEVMLTSFLTGAGLVLCGRPASAGAACSGFAFPARVTADLASAGFVLLRPGMLLLLLSLGLQLGWFCVSGSQKLLWNSRLSLIFDHPNVLGYVAAWSVFYGLIALPRVWSEASPWRFAWLLAMGAGVTMVAYAGSRGVYFGFLLGFVPIFLIVYRRWLVPLLLIGLVGGGLVFSALPAQHQERLLSAASNPIGDVAVQGRMPIWEAAMQGFEASPFVGNGLRSFAKHHEAYVRDNREELAARSPYLESRVANPHNLYLGLLYAYGGVGTLLLAVFVGSTLLVALRRKEQEDVFYLASVLFLCGAGLVDYSLHRKDGIMILMIPAGMVYARSLLCRFQACSTLPSKEK